MWSSSEDGGAFAECFFAQYPLGMGQKPPPPVVRQRLASEREARASDTAAMPSQRVPPFISSTAASDTGTLVVASSDGASTFAVSGGVDPYCEVEELAETTEKTREALEGVLRIRQMQKEDISGRKIRQTQQTKPVLEIVLPGEVGAAGMHDPAPIVRSPTRTKKGPSNLGEGGASASSTADGAVTVPFSIGNWKNKRKLIIPLEQRLAQQADMQADSGGGISEQVMSLAMAMQQARKEVEAEQAAREKAHQEEEERRQAEREAEATRRARELLEKAALDMVHSSTQRKKETREERLDRIRLERELREREKQQEVRQRRLAKAAARLGITVEALEADEDLLKTVDEAAAGGHGVGVTDYTSSHFSCPHGSAAMAAPASSYLGVKQEGSSMDQQVPSLYADDDETGARPAGGIRKGVFGSAVISNEGIRREMEALVQSEELGVVKDGLQLGNDDGSTDDDDEDDGGLGMDQLMKRRRRL
ncbi:SNW domain-containing protein 1 [Trypanosoma rangeli]|uniref:SNW domain-containing protein 1 n=1 Tax=Trypanosoma rangeli TaxID=5698 RepID=A0A422N165_TRYRA|nr:SNW domain-containing protein 1 [Trypanosoma rangeli]RNE99202.1 SNW domain-containing protein 1 [Trypanosoma rangeli]|eukprot:RNE99202.1 SNW domain-containing protein 1 [Trypanosoma rangeli]